MNCYGCRFAREARELPRQGEQVRCAKAEELFGGTRWVNVRRSDKTGKLLKSKCGTYEPFTGDDSVEPELMGQKPTSKKPCANCSGTGKQKIRFIDGFKSVACTKCEGKGNV
jgi:hypothetical protein